MPSRRLIALVTAGELDADLPLLYNTIGDRLHATEAARLDNALARFSIGDRVRIGHDQKPHGPGVRHGVRRVRSADSSSPSARLRNHGVGHVRIESAAPGSRV